MLHVELERFPPAGISPSLKLDRLIARLAGTGRASAQRLIVAGRVKVEGVTAVNTHHEVDRFMRVELDKELIQQPQRSLYLMLHKPAGVLSATTDERHSTVLDLIDDPDKHTLHIAGRLDRDTSGLLLLTNDGRWSKRLMHPSKEVPKVYHVETRDPIAPDAVEAFARGFHFHTEDIVTRPAALEILGERAARLTLHEGRYHQVKRMFHRVHNRVTRLHRESIGSITLPDDLAVGQWRALPDAERGTEEWPLRPSA